MAIAQQADPEGVRELINWRNQAAYTRNSIVPEAEGRGRSFVF
jgi:hypothetical protein